MKLKMTANTENDIEQIIVPDYIIKELVAGEEELKRILKSVLPNAMEDVDDPDINGKSPDKYILNLISNKLGDFNNRIILACELKEAIVGILIALPSRIHKDAYHIFTLGVFKQYRNQDIGKKLIIEFMRILKLRNISRMTLDVHQNNLSAIKFYRRIGFKEMI